MAGYAQTLLPPTALTNVYTTNLYQGGDGVGTAAIRDVITHMHIANKTGGAVTFRMYLGATGGNVAGTELFYDHSIAANSEFDYYCRLALSSTQFLVGGASAGTSLTITLEGYQDALP